MRKYYIYLIAYVSLNICSCRKYAESSCIANLKEIDGAKETWILDHGITNIYATNDITPTIKELKIYIKHWPRCPNGGTYAIGTLSEPPRCSISTDNLLPQHLKQEFAIHTVHYNADSIDIKRKHLDVMQKLLEVKTVRETELDWVISHTVDDDFERLIVQAFVERLLISGDKKMLVRLLAKNCPEYVALTPLEYVLASSKYKDMILALPQAYSSSNTNTAKAIVRCLERAFPELKQAEQTEKAFVETCAAWYISNRVGCTLNANYKPLSNYNGLYLIKK